MPAARDAPRLRAVGGQRTKGLCRRPAHADPPLGRHRLGARGGAGPVAPARPAGRRGRRRDPGAHAQRDGPDHGAGGALRTPDTRRRPVPDSLPIRARRVRRATDARGRRAERRRSRAVGSGGHELANRRRGDRRGDTRARRRDPSRRDARRRRPDQPFGARGRRRACRSPAVLQSSDELGVRFPHRRGRAARPL